MNARASMVRRDVAAAGVITFAAAALLFAWLPSPRPGFAPPPLTPPTIVYRPALLTTGNHLGPRQERGKRVYPAPRGIAGLQEHYDEFSDTHARHDRNPALIALSTAMMLPLAKRGQIDTTVTPPLDTAARLLRFPDKSLAERQDQIPMLTPPRHTTPMAPQRLALPFLTPTRGVIGTQSPVSAAPEHRIDLTGNWQGRSVDLAPILALSEPSGPWSFTAVLRYDETGRVQHALLESAELDLPRRNEVVRRLYQCRITPSGTPGEGRLTLSGPGKP